MIAVGKGRDDGDGNRLLRLGVDESERIDELIPAQRQAKDARRDQTGDGERQDDLDQDIPARGSVHQGAFLKLIGDGFEIAHQQPCGKRDQDGGIGQDQCKRRIKQTVLIDDGGQRDKQDGRRHQIRQKDNPTQRMGTPEANARDRIGREG